MSSLVLLTPIPKLTATVVAGLDSNHQKNVFLSELERISFVYGMMGVQLQPMFFIEGHQVHFPGDVIETTPTEILAKARELNSDLMTCVEKNDLDSHCQMAEVKDGVARMIKYSELPPEAQSAAKKELVMMVRNRTKVINYLANVFEEAELL